MKKILSSIVLMFLVVFSNTWGGEPERAEGISVYLVPEHVVREAHVDYVQRFIVKDATGESVLAWDETAEGLMNQIKQQPAELRANGVWLVVTQPASYSTRDNQELENLGLLAETNHIPLFQSQASELPHGW